MAEGVGQAWVGFGARGQGWQKGRGLLLRSRPAALVGELVCGPHVSACPWPFFQPSQQCVSSRHHTRPRLQGAGCVPHFVGGDVKAQREFVKGKVKQRTGGRAGVGAEVWLPAGPCSARTSASCTAVLRWAWPWSHKPWAIGSAGGPHQSSWTRLRTALNSSFLMGEIQLRYRRAMRMRQLRCETAG